jgi:purine-binding chemotaxis protein CheW
MSDARKRARRGSATTPAAADTPPEQASTAATPPVAETEGPVPEAPAAEPLAAQTAEVEVEVAASETPAPTARAPISTHLDLPSSGLAEDILGALERQEALAEAPLEPVETVVAAVAEPVPQSGRSRGLSFFGAPLREERQAVEATEHLVTFLLAEEEYGVDVRLVQEIIRVTSITPVPRAPEFIKGVINLRGRIIPVVDVKRKLGLGDVDEGSRLARIVVVRLRDRLVGVLVDGASQVLRVPVSSIEAAPDEVVSISQSFIRGVAKLEKRLIILIALQDVLVPDLREAAGAGA